MEGDNSPLTFEWIRAMDKWRLPFHLSKYVNVVNQANKLLNMLCSPDESESQSVMSNSLRHHGLHSPWNSLVQNTGVGSLSLLQGIFMTWELDWGLLHWRQILCQLSYQGSPERWYWWTYLQGSSGNADIEDRLVDTWKKKRVGQIERVALKHIHYPLWNRQSVEICYMMQGAQSWYTVAT